MTWLNEDGLQSLSGRGDRAQARINRCRRCLIDFLPLTVLIVVVIGLLVWALAGCAARRDAGYTTHDEIRASCATAAHAYGLAIERTRAGEMAPGTFRAVDDGYQGVLATCRRALTTGAAPAPGDAARVQAWTVRAEAAAP